MTSNEAPVTVVLSRTIKPGREDDYRARHSTNPHRDPGPICVPKPVPCVAYSAVVACTDPDAGLDGSDARVLADASGD